MDERLDEILAAANWKELTPTLLYYGESLIRNCRWRGVSVTCGPGKKLCVDGCGADDFLQLAVERLLNGQRTYDHSISLEQNLRRTIRSIIWSANKSCRRSRVSDLTSAENEAPDVIESVAAVDQPPDAALRDAEELEQEKRTLQEFEQSLRHDEELQKLVTAYKAGHFKPRDVQKYTGIPAPRISELKRKLRSRVRAFESQGRWYQNE